MHLATAYIATIAAAIMTLPLQQAQAELPLPTHTTIPDGLSTVICPTRSAAERLLEDFYSVQPPPNNFILDVQLFFAGLRVTGCVQNGPLAVGDVTIDEVFARRELVLARRPERFIAFSGRNENGWRIVGVVSETLNEEFPRSSLAQWLQGYAPNGILEIASNPDFYGTGFLCQTVEGAQRVVQSIGVIDSDDDALRGSAFTQALFRERCAPGPGRYRVLAVGQSELIGCGYECAHVWTVLEAETQNGRVVGLLFDAGEM